jgi:hypothetical protein
VGTTWHSIWRTYSIGLRSKFYNLAQIWYDLKFLILKSNFRVVSFQKPKQKIVNTLSINVICFFISSVFCSTIILIFKNNGADPGLVDTVIKFAVIPGKCYNNFATRQRVLGLVSYSANYYIYFWRSSDYKRAFNEQLQMIRSFLRCKPVPLFVINKNVSLN